MQPSGDIGGLAGLYLESPFCAVCSTSSGKPRLDQRKEYKNAMNMFTERAMTPAHREAMTKIGEEHFGSNRPRDERVAQAVRQTKCGRSSTKDRCLGGSRWRSLSISSGYRDDELCVAAKQRSSGQNAELCICTSTPSALSLCTKAVRNGADLRCRWRFARGKSSVDPLSGDATMGSDTVDGGFPGCDWTQSQSDPVSCR